MPDLKVLQVIPIYFILISENVHILSGTGNTETQTKTGGISHMRGRNFLICGLTGWCMEILFTSTGSFLKQDKRLIGRTSVWMFPIYGTAAVIAPLYRHIKNLPALLRGCIYSVGIFSFEYISGTLLKHHGMCPWDYSQAKANIGGVIRLDYAPLWMAAGLLFERILIHCNTPGSS